MKTLQLSTLSFLFILFSLFASAQTKTGTFKVAGECGMCKSKIEGTAKKAGASYALWNEETKELTVKYSSSSSNDAKIQKAIAAVGYDTPGFKATDEAYNALHGCCKYERTAAKEDKAVAGASCCKDGKCSKGMDCCKDGKCVNCCADGNCSKDAGSCTKEGSMSTQGSNAAKGGASCCSKS